jgi:hypothetical protein
MQDDGGDQGFLAPSRPLLELVLAAERVTVRLEGLAINQDDRPAA